MGLVSRLSSSWLLEGQSGIPLENGVLPVLATSIWPMLV